MPYICQQAHTVQLMTVLPCWWQQESDCVCQRRLVHPSCGQLLMLSCVEQDGSLTRCSSTTVASSWCDQAWRLMLGCSWWCHRSRHCLPMRPGKWAATELQLPSPILATSLHGAHFKFLYAPRLMPASRQVVAELDIRLLYDGHARLNRIKALQ